jgi:type VI secretion system protein ImpB
MVIGYAEILIRSCDGSQHPKISGTAGFSAGKIEVLGMARESVQKKLTRVRPPRVQISYEVEVGNAIELKELPFVLGVVGDFTGQPTEPLARLKDRRFVDVNPENFDSVLESMRPHLAFSVENKLAEEANAGDLRVDLNFRSLEDFEPEQVARQIRPLRELLDLRGKLNDLRGTLQTNEKLDQVLMDAVSNTEKLDKLRSEMGIKGTEGDGK